MRSRTLTLLAICMSLAAAPPAAADPLDDAAIKAEPQYYLMSLPDAPVAEIAEAVLGETLGLPFTVDPDVRATMSFQIEGLYSPRALATEFGYRLWNADVAFVDKPSTGLWLIPKTELAAALAEGATLVSPVDRAAAAPNAPSPTGKAVAPQGPAPANPRDNSWLAWLLAGWVVGALSMGGWIRLRRGGSVAAKTSPTPVPLVKHSPASDDLVIPRFGPETAKLKPDPAPPRS